MQLSLVSAISFLAAISAAVAASPLAQELQQLGDAASDVKDIFANISPVNMIQQVPRGIHVWRSAIITPKQEDIQNFPKSVDQEDQPFICQNFVDFATSSQEFMNVLIGRKGLITATPFGAPIAAILRIDESLTQTLSSNIEGVVPECKEAIAEPSKQLQEAYKKALDAYSN